MGGYLQGWGQITKVIQALDEWGLDFQCWSQAEPKAFPSVLLNRADRKDVSLMQGSVWGFGPYCTWGQTKELQLSCGSGMDGSTPGPTKPMESGAVGFREPGTCARYTNTDLLRFTFLGLVRLSPGHPVTWNDKNLWEGQVFKLGCDILVSLVWCLRRTFYCRWCNVSSLVTVCYWSGVLEFSFD